MADVIPDAPQNDWLQTINDLTGSLTKAGQGFAGVYSTFMGAKTTAELANSQRVNPNLVPTQSELNAINQQRSKTVNIVTYLGIGLAGLATLALIYKVVKG